MLRFLKVFKPCCASEKEKDPVEEAAKKAAKKEEKRKNDFYQMQKKAKKQGYGNDTLRKIVQQFYKKQVHLVGEDKETEQELKDLEEYEKDDDEESGEDALMGLYEDLNQDDEGNKDEKKEGDEKEKKPKLEIDKNPFLRYGIGI